ncbi:MAG: hypothetical protein M1324_03900 [Patescibacteria group bacterium]|nr:hypothetical protein [Patescibacteria group bacterium]
MHCYGSDDPEVRTAREFAGITEYLDAVAKFIIEQKPESLDLLVCGGMKDTKGVVEADSIAEAMNRRLAGRLPGGCLLTITKIYEKSTISIVQRCFEWNDDRFPGFKLHLVIICDKARERKTRWLAKHYSEGASFEVVAFKRRDNWKTQLLRSNRIAQMLQLYRIKKNLEGTRQKIEKDR